MNPSTPQDQPLDQPLDQQIDRYADGELPPAETAAFEARLIGDPALTRRVEQVLAARERLRAGVARAMQAEAPDGLRRQVAARLAADRRAVAGRVGFLAAGPRRANLLAVAASLAMVAGAVLFGIFGPRVTERPASAPEETPVTEVAAMIASEHASCSARGTCSAQPRPWRSREEAEAALSALLDRPVRIPDLSLAGFEFCCGGPSCMPGACEQSGHLLFCRDVAGRCSLLSVFLVPVEAQYLAIDPFGRTGPLQCGTEYSLRMPAGDEVRYWCDGSVTWFVKASHPADFDLLHGLFPG